MTDPRPAQTQRRPPRLALLTAAVTLATAGLLAAIALGSGAYQVRPVLSGSMRPGLPVGGVVITHRVPVTSLQLRDVIVFHRPDRPGELVVHRIIALTPSRQGPIIETQGDANNTPDPWRVTLSGATAYRAGFAVPTVGYVAVWMHGPAGRRTLLVAGALLIAAAALGRRPRRPRRRSTGTGTAPAAAQDAAPAGHDGGSSDRDLTAALTR